MAPARKGDENDNSTRNVYQSWHYGHSNYIQNKAGYNFYYSI